MTTQSKRPYEFGRTWNAKVPRYAVKKILGHIHVSTPWPEIEADLNLRMDKNTGYTPSIRRQTIAFAKLAWEGNLQLYRRAMS